MSEPTAPGVVVTTPAQLRQLINATVDQATDRAVRRLLAELRVGRHDEWLTTPAAQRAYGVGRTTLYRWRKRGEIESRMIGGKVYYRPPGAANDRAHPQPDTDP